MRFITIILFLSALLFSNETKRIEDIVNDITQLRQAYESCKSDLRLKKERYNALEKKMQVRGVEIDADQDALVRENEDLKVERDLLTKKTQEQARQLKSTQKRIATLEQLVNDQRTHIATISSSSTVTQKPCTPVDNNPFPKLLPKNANEQQIVVKKEVVALKDDTHVESKKVVSEKKEKQKAVRSEYFNPTTFHLKEESTIYNAPKGEPLDMWEVKTSFTSNERRGGWTRITGYFVEGKWRPSGRKKLWIESERVEKKIRK